MKRRLSIFMAICFIFLNIVPVQAMNEDIIIQLPEDTKEITTKHIQELTIESMNQLDEEKDFNIVLALVDYKGRVINYITSKERLEGKGNTKIKGYTKIVPEGYKVKAFAWNNLEDRQMISNIIEIPVVDGYILEEIAEIDELNVNIPQWSQYELPREVPVKMNTGDIKNVPVKWNRDTVDTTKTGKFIIEGTVVGYKEEKVILNLNIGVVEKIDKIEDIYLTIDQGDEFYLPDTVIAIMSSGSQKRFLVQWETNDVDTSIAGEYIFEGTVKGYEDTVKLNLTVEELNLNQEIDFVNSELEEIIREEIGKEEGNILKSDLLEIKNLNLQWALYGDFNLEDLKHLKNLESLDLGFSQYDFNLMPLSNLVNLKSLNLYGNQISDINPLERLINLEELNLAQNNILNIESLRNLTKLTKLQLNGNSITDIKALKDLIDLRELNVGGNKIIDFTPTAKYYDNLGNKDFEVSLLKANEENIIKHNLNIGESIVLPYGIQLFNGKIVFINWEEEEIVAQEDGVETVKGQLEGNKDEVYFQCTMGETEDRVVVFPDENLENAVRRAIDKNKGDIYYSDVKNLKVLDAIGRGIKDLTGIENLKGLEKLGLWANLVDSSQLVHLKDLRNLKNLDLAANRLTYIPANAFENMHILEELVLDENQIVEIDKDAFNGLTSLRDLLLEENRVSNIEAVSNLETLESLFIRYNYISDISYVKDLKNLKFFWADNNEISNISPLNNLTELEWVNLKANKIKDISPLENSTKISRLKIEDNEVENINAVANMSNLEWLEAKNNRIQNIDGVKDLVGLTILNLANNKIDNIEALRKLENLSQLYLSGNEITDFSPVADFYYNIKRTDFNLN